MASGVRIVFAAASIGPSIWTPSVLLTFAFIFVLFCALWGVWLSFGESRVAGRVESGESNNPGVRGTFMYRFNLHSTAEGSEQIRIVAQDSYHIATVLWDPPGIFRQTFGEQIPEAHEDAWCDRLSTGTLHGKMEQTRKRVTSNNIYHEVCAYKI